MAQAERVALIDQIMGLLQQLRNEIPSGQGMLSLNLIDRNTLQPGEITADQAFEEIFWMEYPRKVAKQAAYKAWKGLKLRDDDEARVAAIMAGLRHDKAAEWRDREADKIPHAATWINQRRWEDV